MEIYSKIIRKCLGILIAALTIPIISGCQLAAVPAVTAMHLANVADQASWGKRAKKIWDEEREQVRDLQARGDPMGDYLYALGNAQGWIHDTRDPLVILDLFKKAAKKGSSDAEIVVGLFYFFGIIPSKNQYTVGLPKQFRDIELGSKLIREGIKKTMCLCGASSRE